MEKAANIKAGFENWEQAALNTPLTLITVP
jgi:hypothetical protein